MTHEEIMGLFHEQYGNLYDIGNVFVRDGYEYATNARILIRRKTDKPNTEGKFPDVNEVFKGYPRSDATRVMLSDPGVGEVVICENQKCPECDGEGGTTCDECNHETVCEHCGGKGLYGPVDISPLRPLIQLGEAWFNADYISVLWAIGVREVQTTGELKPLYFSIGEYEGFAMPTNSKYAKGMMGDAQTRIRKALMEKKPATVGA